MTLIVSMVFLTACSSTDEKEGSILDAENNSGIDASTSGIDASTSGVTDGSSISGQQYGDNFHSSDFNDPNSPLSKQTIYFMYDSSQIQQQFIPVVAAHAQYLLQNPSIKVILEGHADERGSREYNIALGEQRGKSVYRMMKIQGVSDRQIEIVSYGEEKPASDGMSESSWQQNRRVQIDYQGR